MTTYTAFDGGMMVGANTNTRNVSAIATTAMLATKALTSLCLGSWLDELSGT